MNESSKKENLDQLDKKIEEFKSNKEKNRPKRLKVQNDGWRMVIELVTGMVFFYKPSVMDVDKSGVHLIRLYLRITKASVGSWSATVYCRATVFLY